MKSKYDWSTTIISYMYIIAHHPNKIVEIFETLIVSNTVVY